MLLCLSVGYWAFGNSVDDNILVTLDKPKWLIAAANMMVVIHVIGSYQSAFHDLLGKGIFNSDGETWLLRRKTAALEFTMRTLRQAMARWVNKVIKNRLWRILGDHCKKAGSGAGVDLQDTKELEEKKIGVKGLGRKKTNEAEHFSWKNDVKVPCGSIVDSEYKDSPLEYNEYVVYDPKMVRIKKNYV